MGKRILISLVVAAVAVCTIPVTASASVSVHTGTLTDGATYKIEMPSDWNGTLLLYSHGYVTPGSANPAQDAGDPVTGAYLLNAGYALAGSSYAGTGWALKEAFVDQIATLDVFDSTFGTPARTIAWGHSLGGIITAGLLQKFPDRFSAALPMCGVVGGGVGVWNQALDAQFAIQQLLGAGTGLKIANIGFPNFANLGLAESIIGAAQTNPQGRARLALAGALGDLPGWFNPLGPEPAPTDFAGQEANQYLWLTQVDAPFLFFLRGELEARAGGNPSWNTGVNYAKQLANSADAAEVQGLYASAGLSLDADVAALNAAPRVAANPAALDYLKTYVVFDGDLSGKPVLTIHTSGDGLVVPENEQAYRSAVQRDGNQPLLRQAFIHRAGHCTFTPAETIAALQALTSRLDTGRWAGGADSDSLEAAAAALGPSLNVLPTPTALIPTAPAYFDFESPKFLRPYNTD